MVWGTTRHDPMANAWFVFFLKFLKLFEVSDVVSALGNDPGPGVCFGFRPIEEAQLL